MPLILVRFGELGLKSARVKKRFINALIRNIEDAFLKKDLECITSTDWGRVYVHTEKQRPAIKLLKRTFGVTSFSPVIETTSDIEVICDKAVQCSKNTISDGNSFAIRARRTGNHDYTSMELAAKVGEAVLAANSARNIRVDLSKPDAEIHIDVRGNKAYLFKEKIPGPGGLPLGTQGKVVTIVNDRKSILAAWLMMKRGCKSYILYESVEALKHALVLKPWDLKLKTFAFSKKEDIFQEACSLARRYKADGIVLGCTINEFQEEGHPAFDLPLFYPLIGMDENEIEKRVTSLFSDEP